MADLKQIRRSISAYTAFKGIVTQEKLQKPNGTKTVKEAKEIGVFLARKDGHGYMDIAKTFGYKSTESVSRIFSKANKKYNHDPQFTDIALEIAEQHNISCE